MQKYLMKQLFTRQTTVMQYG